ncbi:helix-turn-helix domain-containing protein [Pedobacter sp. AW31-3R]|uniref:helix-turn-helix domain-containing protein n=1 Tax=Pedobacter sp. AW31-3R TaxID=3445781 RepID=UPI003FA0F44B
MKELKREVYDSNDLAHMFHKSLRTISRWRKIGLLPKNKVGAGYYYHREDVASLLRRLGE